MSNANPPKSMPEDPRLRQIAHSLSELRIAAALCDHQWTLRWTSDELKTLLEETDESKLGYGRHIVECYLSEPWSRAVTDAAKQNFFTSDLPRIAYDTEKGVEFIAGLIKSAYMQPLAEIDLEPEQPTAIWTSEFDFVQGDLPPVRVNSIHIRLHDYDGSHFGNAIIYDQSMPASVTSLVLRGDEGMFERMVRLYKPGSRAAAILFADLQASTTLSRKLSSAAYFHLVRAITTNIDEVVVKHTGIVGKHAGRWGHGLLPGR